MRILIIKPSSLGDVVHALPAVNLIRRRFPDAHITWLINDSLASLFKKCPVIDELILFPRHDASRMPALLRRLRQMRFDTVIDLQGLLRSGILTWASGASRRIGLSFAREGSRLFYNEIIPVEQEHAVERNLRVAAYFGCDTCSVEFPLGLDGQISARPFIAINPSARWPTKLWGDERFGELVRRLPQERVVVTGSASEAVRLDRIAQGARNLAGKTDLSELAEIYRQCAVVITNDSGPMHLAAAVGTPVVAIFGPTDPALTGPYGSQHVVLRAGVACSPCLKAVCKHRPRLECMTKITVEQVLAAAQRFLG
jgi:lipopolysaccharide heptosyltransferase I